RRVRKLARAVVEGALAAAHSAEIEAQDRTILRNVALLGVDSVQCPLARREEAWGRLAAELTENDMADAAAVVGLEDLPALADAILAGQVRGRTIVDVRK
ncbi:oxidoreductase, partial [Hansschlegelia beijingensis]